MCKIFSLRITHHVLFVVNYIITTVNYPTQMFHVSRFTLTVCHAVARS